jgi:hypothetical protein
MRVARVSRSANATIGLDIAMYSAIFTIVETSLSGVLGSGDRQTPAVDKSRTICPSPGQPTNSTASSSPQFAGHRHQLPPGRTFAAEDGVPVLAALA